MRTRTWLLAILLTFVSIIANAQDANEALVRELYVKSGLEKQIDMLPAAILANIDQEFGKDQQMKDLPKNVTSAIRVSVLEAFAPESLKQTVLPLLGAKLTTRDIKDILEWFDSPTGKKFARLEEAAAVPEAEKEMEQYVAQLQNSPQTEARFGILKELDAATKSTESSLEAALGIQTAVIAALIATQPAEQQSRLKESASREMEKNRPQMEAFLRSRVIGYLLYAYRSATEAELQKYIEFAKSPAGSKYNSVSVAALKDALMGGSIRFGKAVGEAMQVKAPSDA